MSGSSPRLTKICEACNAEKNENSFNDARYGGTVCSQCEYARKKDLTDMDRARIVARKIIERNGWQFATEEDKQACIERLTWDGSRRTQQKGEIERWEKTPPNKRG